MLARDGYSAARDGAECDPNRSRLLSYIYASSSTIPGPRGSPLGLFTVTRKLSLVPGRSLSRKLEKARCNSLLSHGTVRFSRSDRYWWSRTIHTTIPRPPRSASEIGRSIIAEPLVPRI